MENLLTAQMQQENNIRQIVRDYGKRLFAFVRGRVGSREDAEDILQDVWYQLSRAQNLTQIEQVGAWLYRVARNKVTDFYRKKSLPGFDEISFLNEDGELVFREVVLSTDDTPDQALLRNMFWDAFTSAIDELPEKQREVFLRNELHGEPLREIAADLNENLKTIISRKGYAVKYLRGRLGPIFKEII